MTTDRTRLSRRDADRILDHRGDPDGPVARLIAAASAPLTADLADEDRAMAIFRSAGQVPTTSRRRLAAVPVAVLAAGGLALSGGGVALAAAYGVDVPFTGHDNRSDNAPEAPSSSNPGLSHTHGPATPAAPGATHLPSATPSPSLDGLCQAYQAGAVPRKASNPAFAALSRAAGGADGVAAYCVDLIGPAPTHPTPTHPTPTHPAPTHPTDPSELVLPTHPTRPTEAPN
jgi:hypothetical protein